MHRSRPPFLASSMGVLGLFSAGLFAPALGTAAHGAVVGACGDPATAIGAVQSGGATTPLEGQQVTIEAVAVGDFQTGGFDGFYVQDAGDGDPATSDGIFVYAPDLAPDDVAAGDRLRIEGTASERFGMTQLSKVTFDVCANDVELPEATELALPLTEADYESVEGTYVTFPASLSILEYFNFGRFGEIALGLDRQYQPTAVFDPGSPEAEQALSDNLSERLTLDDGRSLQNADPARHPNGEDFALDNRFRGGDLVTDAAGVIDFRFGQWRLQPTIGAVYEAVNERRGVPEVGGSTTVASFNVLNYFTTLDSRGADNAEEFDRQEAKIVAALAHVDADVFGLIEIENNAVALTTLVAALNEEVGTQTYAALETGPIGTDEITTAFIYKPSAVTPTGDFATLTSTVDARFLDSKNRPALAQTFVETDTEAAITVVVNHLKSKGSSCEDVGDPTDPDGQGNCNGVRTQAAQALVDWSQGDPTGSGEEDVLLIGDLNAYDKEDPIDTLKAGGFTDLLLEEHGELAYSYVFDGQLGYLDYALTNDSATPQVTGAQAWHINADEANLLNYDTSFKKDAQDAIYAPDPFRSSDHDPVLVGLDLGAEVTVERIAGEDRYGTAAKAALALEPAEVVYVASGQLFPDALSAAPAAIVEGAPLLLTKGTSLPDVTAQALSAVQPESVVVLGGSGRIEDQVLNEIASASGAEVTRVSGTNRYGTAAEVSKRWATGEADTVYLASGETFADALSVGPLAGIQDSPVLLTDERVLSSETAAALQRLEPERIVVLGGPTRVSDAVLGQVQPYAASVDRLFGEDRYETAALIGAEIPPSDQAFVASGEAFPDALAGGVVAGLADSPMVLTKAEALNTFAASVLVDRAPSIVTLIGGEMPLNDAIRTDLISLLGD